MKQLSGLDATFLYLETPEMPMHVGALHVLELPAGHRGRFATQLRAHVAARLPIAPVLRRRLWWMPLNMANPAWVDADPDLRQHIVEIRLPKGSGLAELEAQVSALHPVLLDRSRPLWKFHVFEGLAPGPSGLRRVALYTQLHHAAVDGQAAVSLANALMDVTPEPRAVDAPASSRQRAYRLGMAEMLRGVLGSQAQKMAQIVRQLPGTVGSLKDVAVQALASAAASDAPASGGRRGQGQAAVQAAKGMLAPRTPWNVTVGRERAFAAASLPLTELKRVGRAHGATVNDMVLAVCSGALRRHLLARRALPRASLVAAVPISLRERGDTTADNQAGMSLVSLGTHRADPAQRLAHILAASGQLKRSLGSLKQVMPTDFPSLGLPWLMEAAVALVGRTRMADRLPQVANLVISNVPGPTLPLYLAGAQMLGNHPCSIVVHGLALNITVQSYDGTLDFGLMADAVAEPAVADLAEGITLAFEELRLLPRPGEAGHPDTLDALMVARKAATRLARSVAQGVGGAAQSAVAAGLGSVVRSAVGSAVGTAVGSAVGSAMKTALGSAVKPRATARKPLVSSPKKPTPGRRKSAP